MIPSIRCRATVLAAGTGALGLAGSVAVATTVFACTGVMGPLTLTPTAGIPGTSIMTSASGLKVKPARYAMHFATATGANCMSFAGTTNMKTITTDSQGAWSNVTMTIPSSAAMGDHEVCGVEVYPIKGGTGTTHQVFTVV